MDKKCEISKCYKFVRRVLRCGEDLMYFCNEHYSEVIDKRTKIRNDIKDLTEDEMIQRLEELGKEDEDKVTVN